MDRHIAEDLVDCIEFFIDAKREQEKACVEGKVCEEIDGDCQYCEYREIKQRKYKDIVQILMEN